MRGHGHVKTFLSHKTNRQQHHLAPLSLSSLELSYCWTLSGYYAPGFAWTTWSGNFRGTTILIWAQTLYLSSIGDDLRQYCEGIPRRTTYRRL